MTQYKKILSKLKHALIARIPVRLPEGEAEFEAFILQVLELADYPATDDYKTFAATKLCHLPADQLKVAPLAVANAIRRQIAAKVAFDYVQYMGKKAKNEILAKQSQ